MKKSKKKVKILHHIKPGRRLTRESDIITDDLFVIIQWPDVQELLEIPGFSENSSLVTEGELYDKYSDSAYFVSVEWLKSIKYEKY